MNNLEQIRARSAIQFFVQAQQGNHALNGINGGNVLSKLPTLIITNGLLSAAAFSNAKGEGFKICMIEIFRHISDDDIGIIRRPGFRQGETALTSYMLALAKADSLTLRYATQEAIAYANYLKRLAP